MSCYCMHCQWILSFVQEIILSQCKNWPTRELVPPCKFSSWVSWSVKHRLGPTSKLPAQNKNLITQNWTVCMRWMDLVLCTRDIGCKNWPTRELVPPCKFSSWVSWSVKHRLGPTSKLPAQNKNLITQNWTVCMRWMDLVLCTRDIGCKNWPTRELVPPCKFSGRVTWSVKHGLVLHQNCRHKIKPWSRKTGLSAYAKLILSFVQEMCVVIHRREKNQDGTVCIHFMESTN